MGKHVIFSPPTVALKGRLEAELHSTKRDHKLESKDNYKKRRLNKPQRNVNYFFGLILKSHFIRFIFEGV